MTTYSTRTWGAICHEVDREMFDSEVGYRFKGQRVFLNSKPVPGEVGADAYITTDDTPYITTDDTPYYVSGN